MAVKPMPSNYEVIAARAINALHSLLVGVEQSIRDDHPLSWPCVCEGRRSWVELAGAHFSLQHGYTVAQAPDMVPFSSSGSDSLNDAQDSRVRSLLQALIDWLSGEVNKLQSIADEQWSVILAREAMAYRQVADKLQAILDNPELGPAVELSPLRPLLPDQHQGSQPMAYLRSPGPGP